jgi:hypothetical protein
VCSRGIKKWNEIAPQKYLNAKLLYLIIDFAKDCQLSDVENDWDPSIIMVYVYFIKNKAQFR